jgi:hypothetical protein
MGALVKKKVRYVVMHAPKKRAPSPTEHQEQAALFEWARLNEKREPWLRWLHAIPNGGKRDARTGARLKAEGVRPGIADIFLPAACESPVLHGLYIEFKSKTGRMTQDQLEFAAYVRWQGYVHVTCNTWTFAAAVIINYLKRCGRNRLREP